MPDKLAIVSNIVTTLAGINTATTPAGSSRTYRTTVVTSEHGIRTFEEVGAGERPYCGVAAFDNTYEDEINGIYTNSLLVKIGAHVTGGTPLARATALDALEDDIKAALHVDATRGGLATWTKIRRARTDEADPLQRVHGTLEMDVLVEYEQDFLVTP